MNTRIYLAGGFKGNWHEKVINSLGNNFICFNPQAHQLDEADKYTSWDLYHVDKCDILLGYMSEDNPSGYGLALEIGYAKAKNKLIILVDDRSIIDEKFARYFLICHESSNLVFKTLEEAINYIKSF
ncbi:nucleoside 2-deoxyribosyltransferase domain-containing protein [Pontimicrobium sp. IMCC45349]|uniref:nucleoside 2-deoxyribosyltransferase domain-containing protein n=1 Tax=Pontimicrobium sp. IMCC45349 TaxID=3391574 RepID=UPI0039A286E5